METSQEHTNFQEYLEELLAIPSSDILVTCSRESKQIIYVDNSLISPQLFEYTPAWKRLLSFSTSIHKSTDTHTLCFAKDTVCILTDTPTPVWLIPIQPTLNLKSNQLSITFDLEDAFLNPYLKNALAENDISWSLLDSMENFEEKNTYLLSIFRELQFSYTNCLIAGNFHHHRFLLVKELEEIKAQKPNALIQELLGNEKPVDQPEIPFSKGKISSLDKDQHKVFDYLSKDNCVVEGPPGTGKSEVISNLLAKQLLSNTAQLVVSEKKTALDVIQKKLAKASLRHYSFIIASDTTTKQLTEHLFSTWKWLENSSFNTKNSLYLSEQKRNQLQQLLDKLTAKELIGGISYEQFLTHLDSKNIDDTPYFSDAPAMKDWEINREAVKTLYEQHASIASLSYFQKACFDTESKLDEIVTQFLNHADYFQQEFGVTTLSELEELKKEVVFAQLLENESIKKYYSLFQKENEKKKFRKLYLEFQKKEKAFQLVASEEKNWKNIPNETQVKSWIELLDKGNWFQKRKATKKILSELKDVNLNLATLLNHTLLYLAKKTELAEVEIKLLQLGVQPLTSELESIYQMLYQWEKSNENTLSKVTQYTQEKRLKIVQNNSRINDFLQLCTRHFKIYDRENLQELAGKLTDTFTQSIPFASLFRQLSSPMYSLIQNAEDFALLEKIVLKANLIRVESLFPELRKFSGEKLTQKLDEILVLEKEEQEEFMEQIHANQLHRFHYYHQLLQTPSAKLSTDDKELKAILKKGKTLLIKEFSKTRHGKTIRELLASDAKEWILLLNPIWLCTPGQLASSFPMQTSLFEVVVFDEASQLPLTHALGALQRSDRVLVCGDSKQMSPGSYFSKKSEQMDLLHHSSFYWKTTQLTHHYRSEHPALIAFSNKHFYNNSLVGYPTFNQVSNPITLHYCAQGIFQERANKEEAKLLAVAIEQALENPTETLGIVAFSQQQLDVIWEQLPMHTQEKILENTTNGLGFFKTLEQVQGEECDRLFISIGYGKNTQGKFQLRMGPLNRRNGHRRLNVLFTRAKKQIHLFTSIKSTDFPLSDNESIQLLRLYLFSIEKQNEQMELSFPYKLNAFPISENKLEFKFIYEKLSEEQELVTFHEVLKKRGWKIVY